MVKDEPQAGERSEIPPAEWIAAAIGFVLVASTLVFLLHQVLRQDAMPPTIVLHEEAVQRVDGGWLLRLKAENRGDETAADLEIEGRLALPGGAEERASLSLDYLPGHSVRRGGLFFAHDPRSGNLMLRAVGYREP